MSSIPRFIPTGTRFLTESLNFRPCITSSATSIPVLAAFSSILFALVLKNGSTSRLTKPLNILPRRVHVEISCPQTRVSYLHSDENNIHCIGPDWRRSNTVCASCRSYRWQMVVNVTLQNIYRRRDEIPERQTTFHLETERVFQYRSSS